MKNISTRTKPPRDTVLYDGRCRFCRSQVAILRRLDLGRTLEFTSLHNPSVGHDFPELAHDDLLAQMVVVDKAGLARGGADAVRYLSRRLPLLWPLAVPLHVPGTLPLWAAIYRFIARNRMWIAGSCDDGTCKLPQ
jgi:predicted DCC family thiol-disulfide oxidoreductase YuxK